MIDTLVLIRADLLPFKHFENQLGTEEIQLKKPTKVQTARGYVIVQSPDSEIHNVRFIFSTQNTLPLKSHPGIRWQDYDNDDILPSALMYLLGTVYGSMNSVV